MTATTLWWLELCDFYGVVVLRFYDKGGIENIHQSLPNSFKTLFYTGTYWKKNFSNYKHMQNKKMCSLHNDKVILGQTCL